MPNTENDAPFQLASYTYLLPESFIAQTPIFPPEDAKLLCYDRSEGQIEHRKFDNLPDKITKDTLVFFNDTRVLPARIRGEALLTRPSGAVTSRNIEILFLESFEKGEFSGCFEAMVFPGDCFPIGAILKIENFELEVIAVSYQGRKLRMKTGGTIYDLMRERGIYPIPPYIEPSVSAQKNYQTIFSREVGSLAAPTASLHFTELLIHRLQEVGANIQYVTLHVGLGTFKIMNSPDIRDHTMHGEPMIVRPEVFFSIAKQKRAGKKVLAVGTTMVRYLESLPFVWGLVQNTWNFDEQTRTYWDVLSDAVVGKNKNICTVREMTESHATLITEVFILPNHAFRIVDEIITNFHLPESTLLVMMSSFVGREKLLGLYSEAISENYRFYSFGDGMYLK